MPEYQSTCSNSSVIQISLDIDPHTPLLPIKRQYPLTKHLQKAEEENDQIKRFKTILHEHPDRIIDTIEEFPESIQDFELLAPSVQSNFLMELLKRTNRNTLQLISSVIRPILKRDFLASLPHELRLQVIGYLDVHSLCTAASVNRTWKKLIDGDKNTWERLIQQDGFQLPTYFDDEEEEDKAAVYKSCYQKQYTLQQNWKKGRFKRTEFGGHEDLAIVTCLQFDSEKIVSGATDAVINIYNTNQPSDMVQLQGHVGGVWALQYVDNTLVSGSIDRTVRVWNMRERKCTHIFKGHTSTVRCLQIVMPVMVNGKMEPSQPLIVTGSRDFSIRVWNLPDVERNEPVYVGEGANPWFKFLLVGHTHSVRSIAAHGNTLVSGSYDNTVAVWNLETGRMVHRMEGHTSNVYSVVIDPIRQQCMSGSMDSTVYIWDLITGECLHKLDGHSILVGLLGITPNYLVSAAADRTLRIWNPNTGICEHVLSGKNGHEGAITCFKHDDEKVISGSEGGLKMWDIKTGKHLYDLVTDVKGVWWVTFDKTKCIVAIHNQDKTFFQMLDFDI